MDKQLICAVAGSGKTSKLIDSIEEGNRYLFVTYTRENVKSIESSLIRKHGRIPDHVYLTSYFSFLYRFCYRPFFDYDLRANSFTWNRPPYYPGAPRKNQIAHYLSKNRYLFANRAAKLIIEFGALEKVIARLEKYFDHLFIDEAQDFAANDFNFILSLSSAKINMKFVGDYYQHTFDTSRDGSTRKNLHKNGLKKYLAEFEKTGFKIDTGSLDKSYRCSPSICDFISRQLGIRIESHRSDDTNVLVIEDLDLLKYLYEDDSKVKLFYEDHTKFNCYSNNWGKCKGLNKYVDVCVVLNSKSYKLFQKGKLATLPDGSKNKLYVACSRASGDLYIVNIDDLQKIGC